MKKSKQGVHSIEERKARERSGSTGKIDELNSKKRIGWRRRGRGEMYKYLGAARRYRDHQ